MMENLCEFCNISYSPKPGCRNRFCSLSCSAKYLGEQRRAKNLKKYEANPKLCKNCESAIAYEYKNVNKYCSHSCAAKISNLSKSKESIERQSQSLKKYFQENPRPKKEFPYRKPRNKPLDKIKNTKQRIRVIKSAEKIYPYSKVYKNTCSLTGKVFYSQNYRKYCNDAVYIERKIYSQSCAFKFSPYLYNNIQGYDLLLKYGIYHPVKNISGVSRDHMFSISDGWPLKIDPEIMSHPANCRLMIHLDNQKKYANSTISIELLKEKIEKWS